MGIPPKIDPASVHHSAIDIIKNPWNQGEISVVCHKSFIGWLAPDITTVSNPKMKPARAAVKEMRIR